MMSAVSTLPKSGYHHGGLPMALVAAALDMLSEDGPDAISLRAVARRVGVSATAPYRHFADKEALLAAVASHGFNGLREVLQAADNAVPAGQALVAQAVAYVRYALENPSLFRLMFGPKRIGMHPELRAAGDAAHNVLANRVAAETPVAADREARVLACWSLVHGLASLCLDGQVSDNFAASHDELTRRVAEAYFFAG